MQGHRISQALLGRHRRFVFLNKLKQLWSKVRTSFWFVPSLMVAVSILLAVVLIEIDSSGSERWLTRWPRMFGAGAEGARGMLSTIAGSMMTVVGVTFSMTLVTLALASSQYTSRILRNFTGDHVTQVVLGMFTGIFTYCLIALRTIRSADEGVFVPSLAVTFAVVLAISGVVTLIFFHSSHRLVDPGIEYVSRFDRPFKCLGELSLGAFLMVRAPIDDHTARTRPSA